MAIDDDAAPAFRIFQRRADHAGLAPGELGHRIEQVREAGESIVERFGNLRVRRVGMAGRHDDIRASESADDCRRRHLRGQRH